MSPKAEAYTSVPQKEAETIAIMDMVVPYFHHQFDMHILVTGA